MYVMLAIFVIRCEHDRLSFKEHGYREYNTSWYKDLYLDWYLYHWSIKVQGLFCTVRKSNSKKGSSFFKMLLYFPIRLNKASPAFVFLFFSSGKIGQTRSALRKALLHSIVFLQIGRPGFLLLGSFNADCRGLLHLVVCIWKRK